MRKDNRRMMGHQALMNRRHALRFPVETRRRPRVLIEQHVIRVLMRLASLLFAWPLMVADIYTDSQRYREAEYIEVVDVGIWMGAFILQVAWILLGLFAIVFTLSSSNGT